MIMKMIHTSPVEKMYNFKYLNMKISMILLNCSAKAFISKAYFSDIYHSDSHGQVIKAPFSCIETSSKISLMMGLDTRLC